MPPQLPAAVHAYLPSTPSASQFSSRHAPPHRGRAVPLSNRALSCSTSAGLGPQVANGPHPSAIVAPSPQRVATCHAEPHRSGRGAAGVRQGCCRGDSPQSSQRSSDETTHPHQCASRQIVYLPHISHISPTYLPRWDGQGDRRSSSLRILQRADPPLADPPLADPPLADPPLADPTLADPSLTRRAILQGESSYHRSTHLPSTPSPGPCRP